MSWWNNIVSAVQSYFSPKPAVQSSAPSWNQISSSLGNQTPNFSGISTKGTSVAPVKKTVSAPTSTPRGVDVQGPTYYSTNNNGGGQSNNVPSSSPSAPQPQGDILSKGISTSVASSPMLRAVANTKLAHAAAPLIGKAVSAYEKFAPGSKPYLNPVESWAGQQSLINEAEQRKQTPSLNEAFKNYSRAAGEFSPFDLATGGIKDYGELGRASLNAASGKYPLTSWLLMMMNKNPLLASTDVYKYLGGHPSNTETGAAGTLPGAAKTMATGQILPSAAKTGAPMQPATGIVPSPATTPRGAVVPSKVETANLPANMQGLTAQNVNIPLAKAITPEAIQSIGQLLLRSVLGDQSPLTSLSPGIAQALWGAPTATSAFGGYEGGAAVPSQTSIEQPKNLPPLPAVLNQG